MATIPFTLPPGSRGEDNHFAIHTDAQIAVAKRKLAEAKTVTTTRLVPGELARISRETGVTIKTLEHIRAGSRWKHIAPAPAETETADV